MATSVSTRKKSAVPAVSQSDSYTAQEVLDLLAAFYGPREWFARNEPLAELIQTVLSQHTSDLNAERSFRSLWERFGSWERIAQADMESVVAAIQSGGLARQKAPRILGILAEIYSRRSEYDISFLKSLPFPEALQWLTSLNGVGPKTARCVLLFALGFPCIPVDTHVHRVAKRLALVGPKVTADQAHDLLESMVKPEDAYRFHVHLIEHGRQICHAQRPACPACPLQERCPSSLTRPNATPPKRVRSKAPTEPTPRRVGSHLGSG